MGRQVDAYIGAPIIIVTGVLFVVLVFALGSDLGIHAGRDEVDAREHYEEAKKDALSACVGIDNARLSECLVKAVESAQEQSDSRQDLYAQRDMATYAFVMALTGGLALAITVAGVWYVRATLFETRRIGQSEVRAYLTIRDVRFKIVGADKPIAQIRFRYVNTGSSPARSIRIASAIAINRLPDAPWVEREVIYESPESTQRAMPDIPGNAEEIRKYIFPKIDTTKITNVEPRRNSIEIIAKFSLKWIDVFDDEQGQDIQFLIFADAPLVVGGKGLKLPPYAGAGIVEG